MREADIEKILVGGTRKLGGRAYKWVSPGNSGVPDRIVILPDQRPIFVELKTENGRLSALQGIQIKKLEVLGQPVRVLKGETEVRDFLADCERRIRLQELWEERQTNGDED